MEDAVIINQKAAELLGWSAEEAVGKTLYETTDNNAPRIIVGVIQNFHHTSLKEAISPAVLDLNPDIYALVSVRIRPDDIPGTLAGLKTIFEETAPNQEFTYYFIDDAFRQMYPEEERVGQIYLTFGILAIFVAGLGLFGLSSFVITQRTKEIGVRKVLGASIREIVFMLSSGFIRLVLLANLIAWPLAVILMQNWLGNFAYRISMTWDIPVISGIIALGIAILTVSVQSVKVALANPADSLRYE